MSLLTCSHCRTTKECKLDPETDEVICMDCGKVVQGVSPFFVNTMKAGKEFIQKKKEAFSFKCSKCQKMKKALLSKDASHAICEECGTFMNVSPHMIQALKIIQDSNKSNIDINDASKQIIDEVQQLAETNKKKKN